VLVCGLLWTHGLESAFASTGGAGGLITDFDGDAKADIAVYRPSSGTWFDHPSSGAPDTALNYGRAGDVPVNADYDGDHRADEATYNTSTGLWAIHNSSGGDTFVTYGGTPGDSPVPGDYDGDGKADIAIYRPSTASWYVHRSSDNSDHAVVFGGQAGDIPVPADYDGDGRVDDAIFRPSTGTWFIHPSSAAGDYAASYGASGDIPIAGDYDGDAKADLAIFRPSTGLWAIHYSGGGADMFVTYGGVGGDAPVPTDYDGDHKSDIAIFRPNFGAWYVHQSSNNTDAITTFGIPGDMAVAMAPAVRTTFFPPPAAGGYDISWPQCNKAYPANPVFGIVGASDGLAYSDNPCLASEYGWAARAPRAPAYYINTADPGSQSSHWTAPGPKPCGGTSDDLGCAYNYGWNAADHAFTYANAQTAAASTRAWWLDIETSNTWSTNVSANRADIQGMVDYFSSKAVSVGIYSTQAQWTQITSGLTLAVPNWVAGASSSSQAATWCSPSHSFTGGAVSVVQYPAGSFDGDFACST
jgi:hypothetical protein